jgi:hypothetical protein
MFGLAGPISSAASRNATAAGDTSAGYGAQGAAVGSQLMPFLTRQLNNPTGFTQAQQGNMLTSAMGGAGGTTAGLQTEANLAAARSRNPAAFAGAMGDIARERDKANAGAAEGIAAKNADTQIQQQQDAAAGLGKMQGLDTDAQLKAMGLQNEDLNTAASTYGKGSWLSDINSLVNTGASIAGKFGIPGFGGFKG